jgi:hypothetical protein
MSLGLDCLLSVGVGLEKLIQERDVIANWDETLGKISQKRTSGYFVLECLSLSRLGPTNMVKQGVAEQVDEKGWEKLLSLWVAS